MRHPVRPETANESRRICRNAVDVFSAEVESVGKTDIVVRGVYVWNWIFELEDRPEFQVCCTEFEDIDLCVSGLMDFSVVDIPRAAR